MTGRPARVMICDDQELMRAGLKMVLNSRPDLEVVAEAENGAMAVRLARELKPDIVLMDVRMPVLDGIAATEQICTLLPECRVLAITTFDLDSQAFAAMRAGASGFILKDVPAQEMLVAVQAVLRGDTILAPTVTRRLIERHLGNGVAPEGESRIQRLTDREREVFALVAQGLSNTQIAKTLFLGETTVKTHVSRILAKLELRDRIHAVVYAYESGFARGDRQP